MVLVLLSLIQLVLVLVLKERKKIGWQRRRKYIWSTTHTWL